MATSTTMPIGNDITPQIRATQATVDPKGTSETFFNDDAAASLVWENYQKAKTYLESNSWLLEWQWTDYLYQSPQDDRWSPVRDGRPVRISRFLIAKNANTMRNQVYRAVWANQKPFVLQPESDTSELLIDAWTKLIWILMKRADFPYHFSLFTLDQALQGTGILQPGWEERTVIKKRRKRKVAAPDVELPTGSETVNTKKSDDFEIVPEEVSECWPFIEYRRLGTTLFDPGWRTPNRPDLSAGYVIDYDIVTLDDLNRFRQLDCYKNIPSAEVLKKWFFDHPLGDANSAGQVADSMSAQTSTVTHAEGEQRQMNADPTKKPLVLLTMWTAERVTSIVEYEGRKLTIRNEEHDLGDHALHYTANWWDIQNSGYGMGIGRLNSGDQRMEQGVLNEVLKMIGMWFNTPLLIKRGENAPTQNVVAGLGTFWQVDTPPDGDVRKAAAYADKPAIPGEAWRIYELAQSGGEDLVGANATTMQGNLQGPGSSAMRTAAGVNRVGSKADENISTPVDHLSWVVERFIYFLIDMVRLKMPPEEIRTILKKKYSKAILDQIDMEQFLNAEFTVDVLAGQKLMAKAAILQLIPFLLQIVQQPQLMDGLHETGRTIDFEAIEQKFLRLSELEGDEGIFRAMTPRERVAMKQNSPEAQKVMAQAQIERVKGDEARKTVAAKGQTDMVTKLATTAAEHASGAVPLERAEGLNMRQDDKELLANGVPTL